MNYISNIQRFSLDDGPGIRTTVFFKGCNLQCQWCHNPECISPVPVLQFSMNSCVSCGLCATVCQEKVHSFGKEGSHYIDFARCILCEKCIKKCPKAALSINGKAYTPEELYLILKKDIPYYETSNGGVTFSGGEPMLQQEFLKEILQICKNEHLHTAVDTAGNVPFSAFEYILPYTDLFLYDIKLYSEKKHIDATGVSNQRIKENLQRLADINANVFIRTPIIMGYNDDLCELEKIADFLTPMKNIQLIQLLPYHNYGVGKYTSIGMINRMQNHTPPSQDFMEAALQIYLERGLPARIS